MGAKAQGAAAILAAVIAACIPSSAFAASSDEAWQAVRQLGRGINLGNALEAPREGAWGITLQADYFRIIRAAGFEHIRLPVHWSAHAGTNETAEIDPAFFARVDWALDQAASNGLRVVLDLHYYPELAADPEAHRARFLRLWEQIARHYAARPDDQVIFEPLNEPHDKLTAPVWNAIQKDVIAVIRKSNPRRPVMVSPVYWCSMDNLAKLELPSDPHLIGTAHFYQPFHFTHQGASWVGPDNVKWLGKTWSGTSQEMAAVRAELDLAATWSKTNGIPFFLGEFGAYEKADMDSRARWTRFVQQEARARGFATAYWEFCSGFGAYDRKAGAWREPLRKALLGK